MGRQALLIGGTGFVGPHLAHQLADRYQVHATGRANDVRDRDIVRELIFDTKPDIVVNLAALTTVKETLDDPQQAYEVSLIGLHNIFSALKECGFSGRFLQVSSSEVYGFPSEDELPLTERSPLRPMSPYSVGKLAAEALCSLWQSMEEFNIVIARPFTHIGPGQSNRFSIANFAYQIAEIVLHRRAPIVRVGRLSTTRDLTDVRDIAMAYDLLIEQGRGGGIYNVCSGKEIVIREVLDELIRLSNVDIEVVEEQRLVRREEQLRMRGCFAALRSATDWEPRISLTSTLADMLRSKVEEILALTAC